VTREQKVFDCESDPPRLRRRLQCRLARLDFGEFNKWLKEYAPSLAFVGSIVALLSYRNSIRVARQKCRRRRCRVSGAECSKFGTETIPQLVALRKTLETAGCKYFENFQVNRGFGRLEPDNISSPMPTNHC